MAAIAVIPARGGSKRIPRKNLREFAGRPLIAWSIRTALDSGLFGAVVVSTEDPEIADVARSEGAEVPFVRPAAIADDHATTGAVMAHAADMLGAGSDDALCCIYPTAPLLTAARLAEAAARFAVGDMDYVFAAGRFQFPPQRGLLSDAQGIRPFQPDAIAARSQDLPPVYHDAGQFYWGAADAWRQSRPIFGSRSAMILLHPWEVCDIDCEDDLRFAEQLFRLRPGA